MKKKILIPAFVIFFILLVTQVSIFIIPPLGMLPQGKTLVILKLDKMKFLDNPDSYCLRELNPNLLCRGMVIASLSNTIVLLKLPYSETLYSISRSR